MKTFLLFSIITVLGTFLFTKTVNAATVYPISALGNCRDAKECSYYCEIPGNTPACWSYGKYILHTAVLGDTTNTLTFPIAQLGNCASKQACMQYCNLTENRQACYEYGKEKGLYKTQTATTNREKILADAKTQLGCTSASACSTFCASLANRQKCEVFARSEGLSRPKPSTSAATIPVNIFTETRQALGCDSETSCKQVCNKPENYQKCKAFSLLHSLSSRQTTDTIQPPHINDLPKPSNYLMPGSSQSSMLRLGCTTEKECYLYCQSHQDQCPGFMRHTLPPLSGTPILQQKPHQLDYQATPK